jgi:predicted ATPase
MATVMPVPFERSIICPALIGRAAQLDALERQLTLARAGNGQVALVAGEAGIGKSRLVAEVQARAAQQGFAIVQGRCFEPDRVLPYAPLLDLLRAFLATHHEDEIADVLGPSAAEFLMLLPELADIQPDAVQTPTLAPEQEKRRCFQALTQFFIRVCTSDDASASAGPAGRVPAFLSGFDRAGRSGAAGLRRHHPDD